jgi:hypothetical protein
MKKQVLRYLLAIVGVVLLTGLIVSCNSGDSEPRFKVIESTVYIATTQDSVNNTLFNKHLSRISDVTDNAGNKEFFDQYWPDLKPLIDAEMQNKDPPYGLIIILKADNYRLYYRTAWATKPVYNGWYRLYK